MSTPSVPQHCPTPRELDDLELLMSGAAGPITGFNEPGSPITLALPEALTLRLDEGYQVELVDPEGLPLARVSSTLRGLSVTPLAHAQAGPFRRLYLTPDAARAAYAGRTVVPLTDLVTDTQFDQLRTLGPLLLVALVGHGQPAVSATGLLRATERVAEAFDAAVIAVPLTDHGVEGDASLRSSVLAAYTGADQLVELVTGGDPLPELADIAAQEAPDRATQGLVLFFTGLSGSGKSTLARALVDHLLEQGGRTVTTLDGDIVRRNLSEGLTFSRADRETNIRRIGWVAAEISRHGGVAICSPIAPFDETRQQVRDMVTEAGGAFFLVHVATPLAECERRDRKGLYAKARRGEIPEFTGISSPYEEPADADVRVDTTGRSIEDALSDVTDALRDAGYLDVHLPEGVSTSSTNVETVTAQPPRPPEVSRLVASAPRTSTTEGRPLRVLFVCTANICRSPYMELRARMLLAGATDVQFTSAGTHGFVSHAVDRTMSEVLTARGVTEELAASFASRPLTRDLVAQADLVLTAEASHRTFVLEEAPAAFRKVFTLGQFAESVERLESSLGGAELVTAVGHRRSGATDTHDVRDPYRRGRAAAETSADQIDDLLRAVLPRLSATPLADA